jgi:subtilisin family serine protease
LNGSLPVDIDAQITASGGSVVGKLDEIGVVVVESYDPSFSYAVRSIPGVQGVASDRVVELAPPDDWAPVFDSADATGLAGQPLNPALAQFFWAQWNLRAISADKAWEAGVRGDGVSVAVLDTGIDYTHQELWGKVDPARSVSFFNEPLPPGAAPYADMQGHGTKVASIIAGSGFRVAGVAPNVTLIAVKVAGRERFGSLAMIVSGIVYAAKAGANVINMSFSEIVSTNNDSQGNGDTQDLVDVVQRAVNYAHKRGAFLVASAGNSRIGINWDLQDGNSIRIPAALAHVAAVSATGPWFGVNPDGKARVWPFGFVYSDFGTSIVSFAAPGGSFSPYVVAGMPWDALFMACSSFAIPQPFPICCGGKSQVTVDLGTSMSAAHVSGVAALVDSVAGHAMSPDQVMTVLIASADHFGAPEIDPFYGFGRINAYRAVTGK